MAKSAAEMGCETVQVFTRSPRGRSAKPLDPADVETMHRVFASAGIEPLVVHAPYFVAPASEKPEIAQLAVQIVAEDGVRAARLGARYVVVHAGHRKGEASGGPAAVAGRILEAAAQLEQAGVPDGAVELLVESGAGGRGDAAGTLEHWAEILEAIEQSGKAAGACLDTAHLWSAGVDLNPDALEALLARLDSLGILRRLRVVHLNDCSSRPGSGRDRHDHIGEGEIPLRTFQLLLQHTLLRRLPGIVETRAERGGLERDVHTLKQLRDGAGDDSR
jgi:deoxyribonuclease-4